MKKFIYTLLLLITVSSVFSQDLIVTTENDSINCKIMSDKGDIIRFNFMQDNEFRKTLISKNEVKTYSYDYFSKTEIPASLITNEKPYNQFRFSVNGGIGYNTGRLADNLSGDFEDYANELRWGKQFSSDAAYFFSESFGLGVKYTYFNSSNEMNDISMDFDRDGLIDFGDLSDDISVNFIGPVFFTRFLSMDKSKGLFSNIGLGYLGYKDSGEVFGLNAELTGSTIGMVGDLGYQFAVSEDLSLGITLSYTLGALTKVDQTIGDYSVSVDLEESESLSRIDLSVGIIFHK